MRILYLHIGIHKTATTAIQRTFSQSRKLLTEAGVFYPSYDIIQRPKHYCHHDVARSIGLDAGCFSQDDLKRFFREIGNKTPTESACLLSSEIFYRLHINDNGARIKFIQKVFEFCKHADMQVRLVITLREQASFIDSLYREQIKQTRFNKEFPEFLLKYNTWLNFKQQIDMWASAFGQPNVLIYDHLDRSNIATDFCRKAMQVAPAFAQTPVTNPSLDYDWVGVKRILNMTAIPTDRLKEASAILYRMQSRAKPDTTKNPPKAHFITQAEADRIFTTHQAANIQIAADCLDLPDQNPFRPLVVIPPKEKAVNPLFLQQALNEL